MRFSWSRCFVLCLVLEIGVTVLVRLMVWFALVHLCLTLGSLWSWFDSSCVDLTRWFMLITLWFGLVFWWWFAYYFSCSSVFWWCDCDSLVANEVTLVAGWCWVNRETRIRSDWGGGCFIWLWFMEFGLTVWLWLCRRAAGRGSWYYWCSSVIQVKVDSPSLIEVCDGCSSRLVVVVNDEWRFVGFRAIVGIRDLVTI